jgi:hypothetical protein
MNENLPAASVLGMLAFRDYADATEVERTLACLHMATDCLRLRLDQMRVATAEAQQADLRAAAKAAGSTAHEVLVVAERKRKRGRPAKRTTEWLTQDMTATLTLEEAVAGRSAGADALEARQDAARQDAARQHEAAGAPLLFADPPPLAAAD